MARPTTLVANVPLNDIPDAGLLTVQDLVGDAQRGVKPLLKAKRMTLYIALAKGRFPAPAKAWAPTSKRRGKGPSHLVWPASEIKSWLTAQGGGK